jgi:hypothetical protein
MMIPGMILLDCVLFEMSERRPCAFLGIVGYGLLSL